MRNIGKALLCSAITSVSPLCFAQAEPEVLDFWNTDMADLGNMRLTSIATGTSTPLDKSAAIATVITDEDIKAMGATDLDEVLETVPGLHVGRSDQIFTPKYTIRGINSRYNAQTLVLLNGRPLTSLVFGNRGNTWGGFPLKAVERVEVIRGPGSALYGADAFAGVINIITKKAEDIEEDAVSFRLGSFDTIASSYQNSSKTNGLEISSIVEFQSTAGWEEVIESDQQTVFDSGPAPDVSLAPGPVNTGKKMLDLHLNISKASTSVNLMFQGRRDLETGPGIAQALDPQGRFDSDRLLIDINQELNLISEDWQDDVRLSYHFATQQSAADVILFPEGSFGGAYPDGFIGNPEYKEENIRLDYKARNKSLDNHIFTLGAGYFFGDIFEVTETKNFFPDFSPRPGGIEDVSDTDEVWMPEKHRNNRYLFIQDEWQIQPDLLLTSGVRYDHYSDFGEAINPRLALVWANSNTVTTKLLYGKAFRAPSISELFVTSNPINLGNPDLDPEEIDTYELAFSHQPSDRVRYAVNVFYYEVSDYIIFQSSGGGTATAQNAGEQTGQGIELEWDYKISDEVDMVANYSYQRSIDETSNKIAADSPQSDAYMRIDWHQDSNTLISLQGNFIGSQHRTDGDTRDKLDSYSTVDLTYRQKNAGKNLDVAMSIRNLFDEKVFEPSPGPVPAVENDFPMPGISLYGELNYRF